MSRTLVFRGAAQDEYDAAALWYEGQRTGLGSEFTAEVEVVLETIAGQPDRYPVVHRDVREAPVSRFPYCVYYRDRPSQVVVVAVFHSSRDPAIWESRT